MLVGLKVDNIVTELGSESFVHSFFSTVSHNLEREGWGSRYPILLNHLYQGKLEKQNSGRAVEELRDARANLKAFPVSRVVWDIDDLSKRPPWGDNIASDITDLSNYFVTSTGRDMFDTMEECLEYFRDSGSVASWFHWGNSPNTDESGT